MRSDGDRWVMRLCSPDTARVRLICVPYAGGSPDLFRAWSPHLRDDVELIAVRLPGHGSRLMAKLYTDWEPLIQDAFNALAPLLSSPFAFYGHSFGARLCYELTRHAVHRFGANHRGLFVSGCRSPDRPQHRPLMHEMPDGEFDAAVARMGGTPAEVLASEALMNMFRPVIRSEIRLAEIWGDRHHAGTDVPITAIYGRDDPIDNYESTRGWMKYGGGSCELVEMPSGHFFVDSHPRELVEVINARLG